MALAKQGVDRFLRHMAMPCADIDDQRIGRRRRFGQGLAKPGVHGLTNEMLDDGTMRRGWHGRHDWWRICRVLEDLSNGFLQYLSKSTRFVLRCRLKNARSELRNTFTRWNLRLWTSWRHRWKCRFPPCGVT